jgi:methyl halide transferase
MDLRRLEIAGDGTMRVHVVDGDGSARIEPLPADDLARPLWGRNIDFAARTLDGGDYDASLPLLTKVARAALSAVRQRDKVERGVPLPSDDRGDPSTLGFWQSLYEQRADGWDLARPSPPLARWFATHSPAGKRALVVGCGRGHEARMLAALGARVTGVDFAPAAIVEARALAARDGTAIDFFERDLFTLAGEERFVRAFDLVVEHCCFCAIDPARRGEYAAVMAQLVPSGGELVGLFYSHGRPGGPPFSVGEAELQRYFDADFELVSLATPPDSIATRQGDERLAHFRRR